MHVRLGIQLSKWNLLEIVVHKNHLSGEGMQIIVVFYWDNVKAVNTIKTKIVTIITIYIINIVKYRLF